MNFKTRGTAGLLAVLLGALGLGVWWPEPPSVSEGPALLPKPQVGVVTQQRVPLKPRPAQAEPVTALPEEAIVPIEELRTPFRLYGSARVSALYERHEFRGVRVEEVDEGSLWELIGVRNGDLVVEFNGERVDNPAVGVQLMNALARDESLRLRVRGTDGLERLLDFRFPAS